jgi:hypothetical protein
MVAFLEALAGEATDYTEMLRSLERGWSAARARVPAQRSTSRAALAVDVMAATPLISATTLAKAIGMSIKCTTELLDRFVGTEIAVEVTHRSARRLFGLAAMAPVRDATTAPRRAMPGRGRGRPRSEDPPEELVVPAAPLPPMSRIERPVIDYAALDAAILECERVIRSTRRSLDGLRQPAIAIEQNEKQSYDDRPVRGDCGPDYSPLPEPLVD